MYKNITNVAALIGDPTRTVILASLSDGRSLTAGELAYITKVSPQTASAHLAKLVEGGLLVMQAQGRHRYYRLSSSKVVEVIEAIGSLAPPAPLRSLRESDQAKALRFARTCYNHLAGELGVSVTNSLLSMGLLTESKDIYQLTDEGVNWLMDFGVKVPQIEKVRSTIPRHIDWTERHHHMGGPVAVKLTARLFELGWIANGYLRRAVIVTDEGRQAFEQKLGLHI